MIGLATRLPMAELLRYQDRLIRRDQAVVAGLKRTTIDGHLRRGRWQRVFPTVYLTEPCPADGRPRLGRRQLIRAAWMWAGDDAVVAGGAAAVWAGLLEDMVGPVGVIVPASRRLSVQPQVRVIRAKLDRRDTAGHDGILITAAYRTAVDLAAQGNNDLLHRMSQGRWLRPTLVQGALDRGAHRRGWASARVAVRETATNPHSEAERLTHRALLAGGVSGWRANPTLMILGHTVRPDLVFDDVKLVIEIDGFAYHGDRDAFERDRQRQNILTAAGWTVLRFTWRQIHDNPGAVVAQIEATRGMLRMKLRLD